MFVLLALSVGPGEARAADIAAAGEWSQTIDASDLVAGPGSELQSTYESPIGILSLAISNSAGVGWQVNVRRQDGNWPPEFTLEIRRTSAGTGSGSVSGGDAYLVAGTTDTAFFAGSGDVSGIEVQLRLSGVSLSVAPDTYTTTLVYTVTAQ